MENASPSDSNKPSCGCCGSPPSAGQSRRGFLAKTATVVLGAAALGAPLLVGLVSFLNPLRDKRPAGRFFRVASLDALPTDGTPRKFPVIADRKDAWTLYKDVPIGSVFLRRTGPGEVKALAVICPHAGCVISYDAVADGFLCPCHGAHFDLDGRRTNEPSKSPRPMDELEVEVRGGSEVWVKFQQFQTGIARKVVKT